MEQYYINQAGGGGGFGNLNSYYAGQGGDGVGPVYSGYQFQGQRGRGWFGSIIKKGLYPLLSKLLPYLGGKAVDAYSDMANDFRSGKDLKEIGKRQLKRTGASLIRDLANKVDNQEGSGLQRRKSSKRRKASKGSKVTIVTLRKRRLTDSSSPVPPKKRKQLKRRVKKNTRSNRILRSEEYNPRVLFGR